MGAVIKFLFLQDKAPKEIDAILTEILDCFLHGRATDLSAPLYLCTCICLFFVLPENSDYSPKHIDEFTYMDDL
jgi:hypothetical protein